ncbi:MAG: hypothetical protein ACPG5U_08360 [Planktomarina sp.]
MKLTILIQRLSDVTIERSLFYIRAGIVHDNLDGLDHVDALLKLRGVDPEKY